MILIFRLLHNISNYSMCHTANLAPVDISNYKNVSLFTYVHGKDEYIKEKESFHAVLPIDKNPSQYYVIFADSKWVDPRCEKEMCKVEKCFQIFAPVEYFPSYKLLLDKQCNFEMVKDTSNINFTNCANTSSTADVRIDFKKNNKYAKNLPVEKKRELQTRLMGISFAILGFNAILVCIGLCTAMYYKKISISVLFGPPIDDPLPFD